VVLRVDGLSKLLERAVLDGCENVLELDLSPRSVLANRDDPHSPAKVRAGFIPTAFLWRLTTASISSARLDWTTVMAAGPKFKILADSPLWDPEQVADAGSARGGKPSTPWHRRGKVATLFGSSIEFS
jgi:hypothetical protein